MRATLALPLLVTGIRADHENGSATADHLAFLAHRFYGRSYLHRPRIRIGKGGPPPQESDCGQKKSALGRTGRIAGATPGPCLARRRANRRSGDAVEDRDRLLEAWPVLERLRRNGEPRRVRGAVLIEAARLRVVAAVAEAVELLRGDVQSLA